MANGRKTNLPEDVYALRQKISELEKANSELVIINEQNRRLVNEISSMVFRMSLPDGRYVFVSRGSEEVTGYTPEEIMDNPLYIRKAIHPDFIPFLKSAWQQIISGKVEPFYEYLIIDKTGRTRLLRQRNTLIRNAEGKPVFFEGIVTDITKQKNTEEDLLKSRSFLFDLIEHSGALICVKDRKGRYELVNEKWENVTGLKRKDTIGRTDEELFPGPMGRQFRQNDLEVMESGSVLEKEEFFEDGKEKRFFISIKFPLRDAEGSISGICGMITEITARKKIEEELNVSKNRMSRAEIISGCGNWEFDMTSMRVLASEGARRIYGLPQGEWTIPEVQKIPLPEYRNMLDRALRDLISENRPYDVEFRIKRPDTGEIADIHSVAEYNRDKNVVFGVIQDITERKRLEETLKKNEEMLRLITENMSDMIRVTDMQGNNIYVSPSHLRGIGYSQEERLGKSGFDIVHPDDVEPLISKFVDGVASRQPVLAEYRIKHADGRYIWLETVADVLRDARGEAISVVMSSRDITARKHAEEELHRANSFLDSIVENIPDMIFVKDARDLRFVRFNRAGEELLGYSRSEMLGKNDYDFFPEKQAEFFTRKDQNTLREKEIVDIPEEPIQTRSKGIRILHTKKVPIMGADGKPSYLMGISEDITDRKRAEEEKQNLAERLNRAEKMEVLGRLAGGVAHDLNNILGILVGYSELLRDSLPNEGSFKLFADNILQAGLRGSAIIQDLLTLARRGVAVSQVTDLNNIVTDYLKTPEYEKLRLEHPKVNVHTNLAADLLKIKGSPIHLSKTIANLVFNAAEAIPEAEYGEISIRTENRYLDMPIQGYDNVQKGEYAVLAVSDTGRGIHARDIGKIFEPFYTKKVMGRSGTGLGLAVVWGTVKDHCGYIDVQSEEGRGTVFTIYFPVTREEITSPGKTADIKSYRGKDEFLLIVDDMKEQRDLAEIMIRKLGYNVDAVACGEEAVEYVKNKKVDLIILDMIMEPGIDGMETYRRILKINPQQKAIIVSGFSENDRADSTREMGAGAFIRKPYTLEKIGMAIRKELDK